MILEKPSGLLMLMHGWNCQVTGELKVEEFSNHSEEDEYIFTVTVVGSGTEQVCLCISVPVLE